MGRLKVVAVMLIVCILAMEGSIMSVVAEITEQDLIDEKIVKTEDVEVVEEGKLTPGLEEKLAGMTDDQEVLVVIQLVDNMDVDILEADSYNHAGVDKKEFERKQEQSKKYDDKKNEEYQEKLIAEYDKIKQEYNNSLVEYYTELCSGFITEYMPEIKLEEAYYAPFIESVMMSKADIYRLVENEMVEKIDYHNISFEDRNYDSINNTYKAIGGDTAVNSGYRGSGIRVGIIESGNPKTSIMGSDGKNIINVRSTSGNEHTAMVAGIIRKFAPDCTIYSYGVNSLEEGISAIETLITKYNVHVINISYGAEGNGVYDSYSNRVDYLAYKYRIPIVVSSGNSETVRDTLNSFCMGPNIIAVGAVESSGNTLSSAKFKYWDMGKYTDSAYREGVVVHSDNAGKVVINKPDVCAPGQVTMYGITNGGTSFSAPHVTGTIVQMMCRNSGMIGKPEALKAALMASAHFKATVDKYTNLGYVTNTNYQMTDVFGAGVIDSNFCYWVARNGRQALYTITSSTAATNTTYLSKQVYVDTVTKPFRIAVSWSASHYYNTGQPYCNDYDVRIYKNGTLVATSNAWTNSTTHKNTNCEIIELSKSALGKYGAGYYEVRVVRTGTWQGSGTVKYYIGMAWEQY